MAMLDVKVRYPHTLFERPPARFRFINDISLVVATELMCHDYTGNPVSLNPAHIDVHLMGYDLRLLEVRFRTAKMLVEITGYDYPDRMKNIKDRLTKIKRSIGRSLSVTDDDHYVTVAYIPIGHSCWV